MATPPNPRVYMADDLAWARGTAVALANFYAWDGHGGIAANAGRANGDATRGHAFVGESSSGVLGWTIIDLDTLVPITSPTCGTLFGHDPHGLLQALTLCQFREAQGGPVHVIIGTDATNHIIASNGNGTLLGTSTYVLPPTGSGGSGPAYAIEPIVTVHGSAGTVQVKVDDVVVLNLTGKNTRNGGSGVVGFVSWHAEGARRFAEPMVHDGTAFLGMQWRAVYIPVASVGTYTAGTAVPSGTKLEAVDDAPADAEAETLNYIELDDTGLAKKVSFVSGALPALALAVRDVFPQAVVEKSDGGVNSAKLGIKSGAVESYNSAALAVPDGWVARRLAFRTNIEAGTPLWTIASAPAIEIIVERDT